VEAASDRTRCAGPQPLVGTPTDRPAGELSEAPQTAPCFHPRPFLSFSPHKERGTERAVATCRRIQWRCLWHPRGKAGQWKEGRAPSCPGGGSAAQGNRRPRAGCLLPHGASPTPNPSGAPAPTHPGAGVGGCRVGSRSNRRGSSAPRTSWLLKARSRPSYLRRSETRAPHPAPRAREEAEAGSRGPRRRRAPSSAGKRPAAAARAAPPRRRSLSRSLPGSVRSCVCLSVGPSLRRCRRRSSPGSAALPRSLSETHGFPLPDALAQEGEPAVGTCPEGRADGALEHPERVVYGPDSYTLGQCAQRVQSPRTLPIRVAPAFPVSGIQRSRPGYPESPGAPEARRLCASAGTGTQGLSDHSAGCETETEGKAKCANVNHIPRISPPWEQPRCHQLEMYLGCLQL
ncbi:hypothetical protein EI555_012013, partial [Monodon monoceros]